MYIYIAYMISQTEKLYYCQIMMVAILIGITIRFKSITILAPERIIHNGHIRLWANLL